LKRGIQLVVQLVAISKLNQVTVCSEFTIERFSKLYYIDDAILMMRGDFFEKSLFGVPGYSICIFDPMNITVFEVI